MAAKKQEAPSLDLSEDERPAAAKKAKPEPLPTDPAKWQVRHSMRVVAAFERWWNKVPPQKRPGVRAMAMDIMAQVDLEERTGRSQ